MEEHDGSMMMEENRSLLMEEEDNQAWLSFRHTIEQVSIIIPFLLDINYFNYYHDIAVYLNTTYKYLIKVHHGYSYQLFDF